MKTAKLFLNKSLTSCSGRAAQCFNPSWDQVPHSTHSLLCLPLLLEVSIPPGIKYLIQPAGATGGRRTRGVSIPPGIKYLIQPFDGFPTHDAAISGFNPSWDQVPHSTRRRWHNQAERAGFNPSWDQVPHSTSKISMISSVSASFQSLLGSSTSFNRLVTAATRVRLVFQSLLGSSTSFNCCISNSPTPPQSFQSLLGSSTSFNRPLANCFIASICK